MAPETRSDTYNKIISGFVVALLLSMLVMLNDLKSQEGVRQTQQEQIIKIQDRQVEILERLDKNLEVAMSKQVTKQDLGVIRR